MNEQTKAEIIELSEIIFEQTNKLISYEHGAPRIEVDIAKENIRKLYDRLELLIDENWAASKIHHEEVEKLKNIEETIDDQVDELLDIAAAQFENDIEEINQQIKEQEEVIEEQAEEIEEEVDVLEENIELEELHKEGEGQNDKSSEEEITSATIAKAPIQSPTTKAKASTEEKTVMGEQLNKKPISNLKSAIGINDKFQFINELFDGSMQTFNQAIAELDQAGELDAALSIYSTIASERNWDEENPASIQLLDYVRRRYL